VGAEPDVQRIPAVSSILITASPVFRAMFAGPAAALGGGGAKGEEMPLRRLAKSSPMVKRRQAAVADGASAAAAFGENKSAVVVSDVDGRAFDILLR